MHRLHSLLGVCLLELLLLGAAAVRAETADKGTRLQQQAAESYEQGNYADAARLREEVLAKCEQTLGADHPDTVQAAADLALAYRATGEYAKALPLAQRVLAFRERTSGAADPRTADALHGLAELYRSMGQYEKGTPLAQRALDIREKTLGANHPDTAAALHSVAELCRSAGEYAKALPLAQRALGIREKTEGPTHPDTAESLNDLGVLYFEMHNDAQAQSTYRRALAIREAKLGADHPLTAETVNNLAALSWRDKDFPQALQLFQRALQSKEKRLGPEHPSTATALSNLAEVYRAMGDVPKAIPLAQRAANIWEKTLGPDHPNTASSLNNLAGFYWSAGDYAKAKPLMQRAETIWEKTLGAEHPETARALNRLAALCRSAGDYSAALEFYRRGLAGEEHSLASVFAVASEEQKLEFLERTQGHYLAALSLVQQHFRTDADAIRFALELVLRRKGIVLDAQARTRDAIAGHLQGDTLRSWQRLSKDRSELAKLLLTGPGDQSAEQYRQAVDALQGSIAHEEQFLSAHSGVVAQELSQREATAELLARRVPADGALVEFVSVRDWDEKRLVWTPTSRYLAFVLTPDGRIALVDIGGVDPIDAEIDTALAAITDPNFLKDLTAYTQKTDSALAQLYSRLLSPLGPAARASGPLIVSPDGELNKVPFAALRAPDGRYVIEQRAVSYVASGRDLLRGKANVTPSVAMLLAANPAFDDRGAFRAGRFRSRPVMRAPDYERVEYPPLPGTAEEAQAIPPLVKGSKKILLGKDATESAVRSVQSPRILHLATHGFFLKDRPEDQASPDPLGRGGHRIFRGGPEGPLARSGLALAGANHADEIAEGDDGILTALEVTNMDLFGTDLAVLSACETALGQIRTGEGVYGLRRAFVLAGVRNLVMSLWPVSDKITRDLMGEFYRAYAQGEDAAAALRAAEVQTIAELRDKTSRGSQGVPFAPVNLWGPFIVQQTGGE